MYEPADKKIRCKQQGNPDPTQIRSGETQQDHPQGHSTNYRFLYHLGIFYMFHIINILIIIFFVSFTRTQSKKAEPTNDGEGTALLVNMVPAPPTKL